MIEVATSTLVDGSKGTSQPRLLVTVSIPLGRALPAGRPWVWARPGYRLARQIFRKRVP